MALAGSLCAKSNSIPFGERITCVQADPCRHYRGEGRSRGVFGYARHGTIVLFAERRIESLKIDRRRLIVVSSLLNLLNAVGDAPLVELATREGAR